MSKAIYCYLDNINSPTATIGEKEDLMKMADLNPQGIVCRAVPFYGADSGGVPLGEASGRKA